MPFQYGFSDVDRSKEAPARAGVSVTVSHWHFVATPAFLRAAADAGVEYSELQAYHTRLEAEEPSMVIGTPGLIGDRLEDDGRTLRMPAPFKFYATRTDHSAEPGDECICPDCKSGYLKPGARVVTFMLPEDY